MKTKVCCVIGLFLLASVLLSGCSGVINNLRSAPPPHEVTTTVTHSDGTKESVKTEGTVWSNELRSLHEEALLGRRPGERTSININTSNHNSGGGCGGLGQIVVPVLDPPRPGSFRAKCVEEERKAAEKKKK